MPGASPLSAQPLSSGRLFDIPASQGWSGASVSPWVQGLALHQ